MLNDRVSLCVKYNMMPSLIWAQKQHDKWENTVCSAKYELWINDGLWALGAVDWKEDVRRRLQRKIWTLQRGPWPHCALQITKYPSVNLFTEPLALTVSLPPVIHYICCWIEKWGKKLLLAEVKTTCIYRRHFFLFNLHILMWLFFLFLNHFLWIWKKVFAF